MYSQSKSICLLRHESDDKDEEQLQGTSFRRTEWTLSLVVGMGAGVRLDHTGVGTGGESTQCLSLGQEDQAKMLEQVAHSPEFDDYQS